jgi:hypothetical protein
VSALPKIFISYAREDSTIAQRLYHDLRRAGAEPWLDTENLLPGQQWQPAIRYAITECEYFIALLSAQAVSKRGFLHSEMKQALELLNEFPEDEIFVIPVRLDECFPSHERLKSIHWVDLFPSYEKGLKKLESVVFRSIDSNKDLSWPGFDGHLKRGHDSLRGGATWASVDGLLRSSSDRLCSC